MTLNLEALRLRAAQAIVGLLWFHVILVAWLVWHFGVPPAVPLGATLVLTLVAQLVALRRPQAGVSHVLLAITFGAEVAILVGLMQGHPWQADTHMYFFAALAILGGLCSWGAILAFVGFTAVHHLLLNVMMTQLVFGGAPDLERVLLHAVILITEGLSLGVLTLALERSFSSHSHALNGAEEARSTAESVLASRTEADRTQAAAVAGIIESITDLAAGDYRAKISKGTFPPEYESVGEALNLLTRRLSSAVSSVAQAAQGVQASGGSLAATATALEGSAAEQVALLDRARGAFSDLGQGIGATTALATQADQAMAENKVEVERGTALLGEVVEAMGLIEGSTSQIRQIVEVMDNIAFQTNLLALNAGVEAARAGETGRGFAVVASEVRALAQRAAESAREIRGLIDQGQGNVALGNRKVSLTTEALSSLIASASRAAGFVSEISARIAEQGRGLSGLQEEVALLEAQARHNASLAGRINAAGQELGAQSAQLSRGMAELEGGVSHGGRRVA
jgi:methyl-accepting chemotaxis protein